MSSRGRAGDVSAGARGRGACSGLGLTLVLTLTIAGSIGHGVSSAASSTTHETRLGTAQIAQSKRPAQTAQMTRGLKIAVIEGEDAVNIIQQRTAVAPIVEVRDRNDNPVAGAVVTFTIKGGRSAAFGGGARTLTVTTDAAGRAVAAQLTPLTSGRVQIDISAAHQGQTATATVRQTNVATPAQAAAAGAAAGGGGGVSGTTLAIIGAAVGAGAAVAVTAAGGGSGGANDRGGGGGPNGGGTGGSGNSPRIFTGPFTGEIVVTTSTTSMNMTTTCSSTRAIGGTLTMTLEQRADGTVTGTARTSGTQTETAFTMSPFCSPLVNSQTPFNWDLPVTGTAASVAFGGQRSATAPTPGGMGSVTATDTLTFSGSLAGDTVSGTIVYTHMTQGTNLVGGVSSVISGSGSTTFPVTLR